MLACIIYVSVLFFLSSDLALSPQLEGLFLVKSFFLAVASGEIPLNIYSIKISLNLI